MADGHALGQEAGEETFYLDPSPNEESQRRLDRPNPESDQSSTVKTSTGPVGEPGLPPSRPLSIAKTAGDSTAPSRSSIGPPRRGAPASTQSGNRGTSNNEETRTDPGASRTNLPNLTSAAFFRPMTSRQQREQAQRPTSPLVDEPIPARKSGDSRRTGHRHRYSNASVVTIEQGQRPLVDADAPPMPTSRNGDDQAIRSVKSQGSAVPLRQQGPPPIPIDTKSASLRPKSPKSFRASFGLQSRHSRQSQHSPDGHTKLTSEPPSPRPENMTREPLSEKLAIGSDRNYEYYNGNTVFFLHGRLLNARQRPLNLVTAFLAILPAALFFGFS